MNTGQIYSTVFLYIVIVLTVIVATSLYGKTYRNIKRGIDNSSMALFLCVAFSLWLGQRPPTYEFGDTGNYAYVFNMLKQGVFGREQWTSDVLWNFFTSRSAHIMGVSSYLTIIAVGYFGFTFLTCKLLIKNNVLAAILFMFGAFSFYSYATNGIRNGLACSVVLFAIALYISSKKWSLISLLLAFVALNIHKSTIVPLASCMVSIFL